MVNVLPYGVWLESLAGTTAETATLRDGPDDEGANSDTGSSHGEPATEP